MTGFEQFVKMQEIDRHLRSEAQWWRGEGVSAANLAIVFRSIARLMDDVPLSPETRQNHSDSQGDVRIFGPGFTEEIDSLTRVEVRSNPALQPRAGRAILRPG